MPVINFARYVTGRALSSSDAPAIVGVDGRAVTYRTVAEAAGAVARLLHGRGVKRLGLLADRTAGAYIGVIAAAWYGMAYVPFSLKAPPERLKAQFATAGCEALLIDSNGVKALTPDLVPHLPELVIAEDEDVQQTLSWLGVHALLAGNEAVAGEGVPDPVEITGEEEAYLIFTSGSSGVPKGVSVSARARDAYIKAFQQRHPLGSDARVAQPCDLSWDMSLSNMAAAFANGAALYLMKARAVFSPARFILVNAITVWHSVPTIADMLLERGTLRPGLFPSLKLTLFAGAPLFARTARAWQEAASEGVLVNSYGPTEMTVECLDYTLPSGFDEDEVPIGTVYQGTETLLLKADGAEAGPDEVGELLLAGPQQAQGYLNDPARTEASFIWHDNEAGQSRRWYRTGDLVIRNAAGLHFYKGRLDHQIKVLGYRVELEEIETQLRRVSGLEQVVVSGYPFGLSAVEALVAFVVMSATGGGLCTADELKEQLYKILPAYMVPYRFFALEALPRNANGKLDRKALPGCMESGREI